MSKMVATLGVLVVGGGLSLCDLCGGGSNVAAAAQPVRVASGFTLSAQGYLPAGRFVGAGEVTAVQTKTVTFKVEGMTCGGCVIGVRKVLTRLPGVSKADVTYEKNRAVVTYDPAAVTVEQMVAAIATLGYKATVVTSAATS